MRHRISIRGSVRRSVRRAMTPFPKLSKTPIFNHVIVMAFPHKIDAACRILVLFDLFPCSSLFFEWSQDDFMFLGQDMAVTEIFANACKIQVPATGLEGDASDDDDVPGNPVGVTSCLLLLLFFFLLLLLLLVSFVLVFFCVCSCFLLCLWLFSFIVVFFLFVFLLFGLFSYVFCCFLLSSTVVVVFYCCYWCYCLLLLLLMLLSSIVFFILNPSPPFLWSSRVFKSSPRRNFYAHPFTNSFRSKVLPTAGK